MVADAVEKKLVANKKTNSAFTPTVEEVQDEVEKELMLLGFLESAKSYILYRAERTERRLERGEVPEHVRTLAEESKKYFKDNALGEFVYLRTYARWIEEENRRETWIETVDRYISFMKENSPLRVIQPPVGYTIMDKNGQYEMIKNPSHFQISNENEKCLHYLSAFFAGWQGISWDQFNFANTHNRLAFLPPKSPTFYCLGLKKPPATVPGTPRSKIKKLWYATYQTATGD